MKNSKCVVAFSGGLDTSAIVPWLCDQGYEVHAVVVDVGQGEDFESICQRALALGAETVHTVDCKQQICGSVLPYVIGLGATYEGQYKLGTALTRPFIARAQVQMARRMGADTLVHGATGKGNDQVRFEFAYKSLAPQLKILAPWKEWSFAGRQDLIDFLLSKGIDIGADSQPQYSMDENLWHLSVEGSALENPRGLLDVRKVLEAVRDHFAAGGGGAGAPGRLQIEFVRGKPVSVNGVGLPLGELVDHLNQTYRRASWAWDLVIENRCTGVKSRGLYINPAAKVLSWAVDGLARSNLNKPLFDLYTQLSGDYGRMLYRGEYFSQQRLTMEAAAQSVLQHLSGVVTLELEPVPYVAKIESSEAIFTEALCTFEHSDFSHRDSKGFIQLSWLASVGQAFEDDGHADFVEAEGAVTSGFQQDQSLSRDGLVSPAV